MATSFRSPAGLFNTNTAVTPIPVQSGSPSLTPTAPTPATTSTVRGGAAIFNGAPDPPNGGVVNPPINTSTPTTTPVRGTQIFTPTGTNSTASTGTTSTPSSGSVSAPVTPTFAPTTYTQSSVSGFPNGYTSSTPTLDSYLRAQISSLFNPSTIENGTASPDPSQYLTSLANNYLQLNPGAGSQGDISQLVNQYAGMYNTWANQYKQYLQANSGNIALPAGSPYAAPGSAAANTPGPVNAYAAPSGSPSPYTPYTTPAPVITNTNGTNGNLSNSQILDQLMGGSGAGTAGQVSTSVPASNVVTTPLGYTQYQPNTNTQSSQTSSTQLTQLILSLLMGQSGTTPSQTTFSQLLNALSGGNTNQSSGQVNV